MVKTVLIVMFLMNDNSMTFHEEDLSVCPSRYLIEEKYEKLKTKGLINDWSALCFNVNFESTEKLGV